jgi:hypothetical protein
MRYLSSKFLLSCFLLFSLPAVAANTKGNGRITGIIKSISGTPLSDAIVRIFREVQQGEKLSIATTDSRGFFKSMSLAPGTYYLQISHLGYQPVTTAKFIIDPGRTTSLDFILKEFVGFISKDDDPRNWDMKTVMRSTSDRRLIFRDQPESSLPADEENSFGFSRSGAMKIASNTALDGQNYSARPEATPTGVSSNFAIAQPLSAKSRMIFSGQLDFGHGAFWRIRDTYNYRPNKDHDYRASVGYGRMNVNYPGSSSISSQMLSEEAGLHESGVQTLAIGLEGTTRFLDLLAIKYGFDYSRLHYIDSKSFFYPSIQILLCPADGWRVQTSFTSRRLSDINSVKLPDGDVMDLSEPTLITMLGDRVSMTQIRHSEIAAQRSITENTAIELSVYQDRAQGPGLPVMVTTITPTERKSQALEMNSDRSGQRGLRITVKQKILSSLSGSVDYVYGDALNISGVDGSISSDRLESKLANYLQQRNQHSITGRINATIPLIRTKLLATTRWYSGNPLTPVDWFSDRMDIGTKSTNFEIRQPIPLPESIASTGRWEVLVDLRNVLNQGREVLPTTDGEIVLNRNPRSLRFGINLSFR